MVSQGSFCDSDCMPGYMQEALDDDGLLNVDSCRKVDEFPFVVDPTVGDTNGVFGCGMRSSSGGIPIVEDTHSVSSDEILSPQAAMKWVCNREDARSDAYAQLKENEKEYALRDQQRISDLQKFLIAKGFSLVDVEIFS